MSLFAHADGSVTNYSYNADGIRTGKQYLDAGGGELGTVKYTLDGNKIVAEQRGNTMLYYLYDDNGSVMGIGYGDNTYTFAKNIQGDVIGIYSGGTLVAKYEYNAYGEITAITNASGTDISNNATHIANINPFRYRGYYYDTETGFYYLQTRYYDPIVGRFINRDTSDILTATPTALTDKNLFAYCDNNPIIRTDQSGQLWDIIFDVGSFISSIYDVCTNPSDPWAWAGLAGDAVDLIPFVTGVGETVKVAKTANKVVDAVDTAHDVGKTVDKANDIVDTTKTVDKLVDAGKGIDVGSPKPNIHGNSLDCPRTNYGYALIDNDNNIMKFGETVNPRTRYSQKYLRENGYSMVILESGSKADIHYWQHDMNMYYKHKYGELPPLNKRGW